MISGTGLYDRFNARNLTPEEVADSFVPPPEFLELCGTSHVLLLGPRGSGKTTLLKMLTHRALSRWEHPLAGIALEKVGYRVVYVPTDIHWHHQLGHTLRRLGDRPKLALAIAQSAITTNVLLSMCTSLRDAAGVHGALGSAPFAELCEGLVEAWRLPPTLPHIDALERRLTERLNDLQIIANRLAMAPGTEEPDLPGFVFLDYFAALRVAAQGFDARFDDTGGNARWSLCFDELELAPDWLQERVFTDLRSTDQRFLLKVSTSPVPELLAKSQAAPRQDYHVIRLWPHRKAKFDGFAASIVSAHLRRHCGETRAPVEIFGHSPWATEAPREEYERGSEVWHLMRGLAQRDLGFRKVLSDKGLNPEDPSTSDLSKRDNVLRKAKPLVLFRTAFTKVNRDGETVRRPRKTPQIYHGIEAIYDVGDGNPRWLIGLMHDLLRGAGRTKAGGLRKVPTHRQARALLRASRQFAALLAAMTVDETSVSQGGVYGLVKSLGEFLFREIALKPFTLDPPGSFIVDEGVSTATLDLVREALYQGAVVLVDPSDEVLDASLLGKRFRLSYMLAPTLKLPLRLYDSVNLSQALSDSPEAVVTHWEQALLFGEQDAT